MELMLRTTSSRLAAFGCVLLLLALVGSVYLLFHGYFDRGNFETLSATWSNARLVAVVAKRSDHEAMSSDQYFVVIADRLLSPRELRHAYYYGNGVAFRSWAGCLSAVWASSKHLHVASCGLEIPADYIADQREQVGGVTISYENIQRKNR